MDSRLSMFMQRDGYLLTCLVGLIPMLGESIAVINETLPVEDVDMLATDEVIRLVELFFLEGHAGVVGEYLLLGHFHAVEQQRVGVFAIVGLGHFFDLDGGVRQVVVEYIVVDLALEGAVIPQDLE
jgi:hypothetical protein